MDIDTALDDIERVIVDGDMRQEARERAQVALEWLEQEREAEPCRCVACIETLPACNAEVKRLRTALEYARQRVYETWDTDAVIADIDRVLGTEVDA